MFSLFIFLFKEHPWRF